MTDAALATANRIEEAGAVLERVIMQGDLEKLSPADRVDYYRKVCASVGLNPLTQPFEYMRLNNKLRLYPTRNASDQLRKLHGISVFNIVRELDDTTNIYTVTAYGRDASGREDSSTGSVFIAGLKGENLANAYMKAETKAKRRLTLSMAGLGWLDETEVQSIQAPTVRVDPESGEILGETAPRQIAQQDETDAGEALTGEALKRAQAAVEGAALDHGLFWSDVTDLIKAEYGADRPEALSRQQWEQLFRDIRDGKHDVHEAATKEA